MKGAEALEFPLFKPIDFIQVSGYIFADCGFRQPGRKMNGWKINGI
jgi:hypothetical protein